MINKYIIVIILVLITFFLINICIKGNRSKNNLPELFVNNGEDASGEYLDKKYDDNKTGFVQFSKDYLKINIELSHGYFKFKNATNDYINHKGNLTINLKSNDYREAPFDTFNNITDFLIKYTYLKLDGKIYKIKMQELIDKILADREQRKKNDEAAVQQKLNDDASQQNKVLDAQSEYLQEQEKTKQEQQKQEFELKKLEAQKKCDNPFKGMIPGIPESIQEAITRISAPFSLLGDGVCRTKSTTATGLDRSFCRSQEDMVSCNFGQFAGALPGYTCRWEATPQKSVDELLEGVDDKKTDNEIAEDKETDSKINDLGEYKETPSKHQSSAKVEALLVEVGEEDTWDTFQDTLSFTVEFESIDKNEQVEFDEELISSKLTLQSNIYDDPNAFTDEQLNQMAAAFANNLAEINDGVPCGWHYDESTGGAGGYFSEIINDPEWQKENPELYKTLSKYICPHYLPVCTGQRKSGIVEGKCIKLDDNCNNSIVDGIMGYERSTHDTIKRKRAAEVKYTNVMQKNAANRQMLSDAVSRMKIVLDEPSIETFQNGELNIDETENESSSNKNEEEDEDEIDDECKFRIENKCYDYYNDVDKNLYESGGKIFNVLFPTINADIFKKLCHNSSKWLSENIVKLLTYKLIIGFVAAIVFWGENSHLDFQIRVFQSFISFIFSEIYILYIIIIRIIKPALTERKVYMA